MSNRISYDKIHLVEGFGSRDRKIYKYFVNTRVAPTKGAFVPLKR